MKMAEIKVYTCDFLIFNKQKSKITTKFKEIRLAAWIHKARRRAGDSTGDIQW